MMFGCDSRSRYTSILDEAEHWMFVNPDSSLNILSKIKTASDLNEADNAHRALLLTQAKTRGNTWVGDDSLINVAIKYYQNTDDSRRLAWSYLYASDINEAHGNDSLAVRYIREAEKKAAKVPDRLLHYYVNYFRGHRLNDSPSFELAGDYLKRAIKYAEELNSDSRKIVCLNELGTAELGLGNIDEAKQYLFEALGLTGHDSLKGYRAVLNYKIALAYFAENSDKKSLYYINNAVMDIPAMMYGDAASIYSLKSSILQALGNNDSAEIYIKSLANNGSLPQKCIAELDMSKIEESRGNYQSALEHLKVYDSYIDSLHRIDIDNKVLELDKKYDLLEAEAEVKSAELAKRNLELVLMSVVVLALLIICFMLWIYIRKRIQLLDAEKAREVVINEAAERVRAESNSLLMAERSENKELREHILKMDLLVAKIRELNKMPDSKRIKTMEHFVLRPDEAKHLAEVVDVCQNGLITKLKNSFPELNDNDLGLCSLISLGIPGPDIAILLGISDSALRKRRQRLKERLATESLDEWLQSRH